MLAGGSVNHASCPALCPPPTTSTVNHNVTETDYLAALRFQFYIKGKMELQETVHLTTHLLITGEEEFVCSAL